MEDMKIIKNIPELREYLEASSTKPCLVPTMGALHEGHLSLVKIARENSDFVAASVFVNPLQFNNPKDLEVYPRELEEDCKKLELAGCDLVFAPDVSLIYQDGFQTTLNLEKLSRPLEGEYRPGHFQGVCTVVSILFNLFQPEYAVFGEKDFQQLKLIEQLVEDMKYPTKILRGPIIREENGLAMSSRNTLLSPDARERASIIFKTLCHAKDLATQGEDNPEKILASCLENLSSESSMDIQYLEIVDQDTFEAVTSLKDNSRIFFAGVIENVRLIDNIYLGNNK